MHRLKILLLFITISSLTQLTISAEITIKDPSFEKPFPDGSNKFGQAFPAWPGWIFAQPGKMQVSKLAHSGKTSGMIICEPGACIRFFNDEKEIAPGRYRLTFYVRGLDIEPGQYDSTVSISSYDGKWHQKNPKLSGNFGWTKVALVVDVPKKKKGRIYVGLKGSGMLWVDDIKMEKVGNDVTVTPKPVVGKPESAIAPPEKLVIAASINCPECGYKNMPKWGKCYACGSKLSEKINKILPPKTLASFEDGTLKPFSGQATVVDQHATDGKRAIKWNNEYISIDTPQNWVGYDYLKADFFVEGDKPIDFYIEIRDRETKNYWTRVNYNVMLMPGKNTLILPTNLFVGEKSRPGRPLIRDAITRLVFSLGKQNTPVYMDHLRLECDDSDKANFKELHAFDFGTSASPVLRGMTKVTSGTRYTKGRGYGFKNARIWRCYKPDVLQPDIVYRDFVNPEKGGFALDLPNGKYHVFLNIDCPGGFWGELPKYRERMVIIEGKPLLIEKMDKQKAIEKYFRFADKDDLYSENTFDKYLGEIFQEKEFDIDVTDGQLNIEFEGKNWTNCLSCLVVYPEPKTKEGKKYLADLKERRRADFNNYFRRLLYVEKNPLITPSAAEKNKGYILFSKDYMEDVYPNTNPLKSELKDTVSGFATAGEIEPVTFSIKALKDLGKVKIVPTDLKGPGIIPANAIKVGYVSNRISRVKMDGSVYTIKPRFVMTASEIDLPKDTARRFWANIEVPKGTPAGKYTGALKMEFADGKRDAVNIDFEVISNKELPKLDVPAGPWGINIRVPWYAEEMTDWNNAMDEKCLALMQKYGCTSFSAIMEIKTNGKGKDLTLDFTNADKVMASAKKYGILAVVNYGTFIQGLNLYGYPKPQDPKSFGFNTLEELYKHVFKLLDEHAKEKKWLPLIVTACDEPVEGDIIKAANNAALLKKCVSSRIRFAGATSMLGNKADDKHQPLVKNMDIANYNSHDTDSIDAANKTGGWAFYNGGNRWTYGFYMYMLKNKYNMKFRLAWHWNMNAGDPYYALDCREDDYSWANANAKGELVPSIHFERIREGIDDYRYLLALEKLIKENPNHQATPKAKELIAKIVAMTPGKDRGKNGISEMSTKQKKMQSLRSKIAKIIKAYNK